MLWTKLSPAQLCLGIYRELLWRYSKSPTLIALYYPYCIQVHHGVVLHFFSSSSSPLHIRLGETTAQDLNLDLGPPSRVHYKEDERMAIHSSNPQSDEDRQYTDCKCFVWGCSPEHPSPQISTITSITVSIFLYPAKRILCARSYYIPTW